MTTAAEFVHSLPTRYQACRAYNHVYDLERSVKVELSYGLTAYHLVCGRCGTKALDIMRGGQRMWARTYEHPEGYVRPKDVDAPTRDDYRAAVLDAMPKPGSETDLGERFAAIAHAAEDASRPRKLITSGGKRR